MKKVLVVEDNVILREFLVQLIKQLDPMLTVKEAGSCKKAQAIFQSTQIDAFFLDIHLSDGSGYDLAKALREIDHYKFKPIVFLTGDDHYKIEAHLDVHCYRYLTKPFMINELRSVLYDVVSYGIDKDDSIKLTLKKRGEQFVFNTTEIVFLEYKNRHLHIHTVDEEVIFSSYRLIDIKSLLPDGFYQCHKSYIINARFIHRICELEQCIFLRYAHHTIPIGRKYKEAIHKLYSF